MEMERRRDEWKAEEEEEEEEEEKADGFRHLDDGKEAEETSIERIFASKEVPSWQNQLTFRAFFVSFILGILFSFIVMKLSLTTGIIPPLNVSASLLGFIFVKKSFLDKAGLLKQPFTRQENTVIQTCVVATSGIAFSATYVGVGMFCPYIVNISLLLGSILSWGLMWPLIDRQKGHWYPAELSPSNNIHGPQGYKVFIAIATILGDGLYNFIKILSITLIGLYKQIGKKDIITVLPVAGEADQLRTRLFLRDQIPTWFAVGGYVTIAILSIITVPHIFHQLKWYYIVVIYIVAPALAFCNSYGCGLTDWSLASTYGKLAIFTIGAWAGASHGGVLAGLAACGVMMNIVSTASDLMQDFKTGYMTLTSPRSMFVSQIIGTAMGCVISPCVFWLFYKVINDFDVPGSQYPAPYALVYRNMSILGVEAFSALPKHCLLLCYIFFAAAMVVNGIKDLVGAKWSWFIPLPMAMAIPFDLGGYFAIDMCVGSLIKFVWEKLNKDNAYAFGTAVASGLICGDGIWTLPSSILAMAGINPPICMKFLSRKSNTKVDAFLSS